MKNEVRPIDANATIEALRANFQQGSWYGCEEPGYQIAEETVSEMPTIAPSPTQIDREAWTAEWEEDGECDHKPCRVRDAEKWKKYKCSKCGYKAGRRTSQKYCPSCARAMTPEAWAELEKRLRG